MPARVVFELDSTNCKLLNFNPRPELHGQDPKPAADLLIGADLGNDCLAMFHPALKSLLYHWDDQQGGDLVDVAKKDEQKDYAPHIRLPKLKTPLGYEQEIVGATLTVHYGVNERTYLVFHGCNVNQFKIEPKQGGTVYITFRVQFLPDGDQAAQIPFLLGKQAEISVEQPKAEEPKAGEQEQQQQLEIVT